jgi:uncharacterized protein (TIGR02266 family)
MLYEHEASVLRPLPLQSLRPCLNLLAVSQNSPITLILYDDPELYLQIHQRLATRGIKVINVTSGGMAMEMIRSLKPALVILGYELQDVAGGDVVRKMKLNPQSRDIPVIILYDPARSKPDEMLGVKADEAIQRPVDTEMLIQKISEKLNLALRRHNRIEVDVGVDCAHQEAMVRGFARNISEGGVFLETDEAIDAGSPLTLSFTLPGQQAPLVVTGKVVRRIELGRESRFGLGVQFTGLNTASRERILDFLVNRSLQPAG